MMNVQKAMRLRDGVMPDLGKWYNLDDPDDIQRLYDWLDRWWSGLRHEDRERCLSFLDGGGRDQDWPKIEMEEKILLMLFCYGNELLVRDLVKYLPDEY